jgi:F-type H+-transporting ATPase subunit b
VDITQIFEDVTEWIQEALNSAITRPDIILLNLVAFVVLVLIVRKFLWGKVTLFLEKRQVTLMEAIEAADQEKQRAHELQEKSAKEYELMKEETRQLKEKLTQEAYKEQEKLISKAKKEAKRRLDQAEKDIQYEIEQANEQIKASIKEVAFHAARKIVKREIDESIHQDIIDEIIKETGK